MLLTKTAKENRKKERLIDDLKIKMLLTKTAKENR